jgi:hypothetical protein
MRSEDQSLICGNGTLTSGRPPAGEAGTSAADAPPAKQAIANILMMFRITIPPPVQ